MDDPFGHDRIRPGILSGPAAWILLGDYGIQIQGGCPEWMAAEALAGFFHRPLSIQFTGKPSPGHLIEKRFKIPLLCLHHGLEFVSPVAAPEDEKPAGYPAVHRSGELLHVVGLQGVPGSVSARDEA